MFKMEARIEALEKWGRFMAQSYTGTPDPELAKIHEHFDQPWQRALREAELYNPWFTQENLRHALETWGGTLTRPQLEAWVAQYPELQKSQQTPQKVAIIMAGNVPLVGMHDLLATLISPHHALIKPSSDDERLWPVLLQVLVALEPQFAPEIRLAEGQIRKFDAVLATGSNNSARYFHYYFGKYPHIIRRNRSSVALLDGQESPEELKALGEDVFRYFGLGCRNVSKVYLPEGFDWDRLFGAFYHFQAVKDHNKYGNNYDYNRAIYLMEDIPFKENGFFILREHSPLHAPVGVLHVEHYQAREAVLQELTQKRAEWQCLVSREALSLPTVKPGQTQQPGLMDYADDEDTLQFMCTL